VTTLRRAPQSRAGLTSWPFTPIEELDLYLETATDPSLIQLETLARGHLDRAALESALSGVLAADPAARRQLAATSPWDRRLRWEAAAPGAPATGTRSRSGRDAGPLTVASWRTTDQLAALREWVSAWPIPLRDRAVRLILATGPEHDVVILQTHHAAFDGISSLALLTAIGVAYRECAGDVAGPGPETISLPAPRPAGTAGPAGRAGGGQRAGRTPVALARVTGRLPGRLPGVVTRIAARTARPDRPGYGSVQRSMPVPRPPRQGSGPFPTVNDLLVAALIRTVDRWNAAQGKRSGRIRISVPVNGRDRQGRWAGPGNQTRLIRVTAGRRERADPARVLAQVQAQTRAGKQRPSGGLDATSRLLATGWAPTAVKRPAARLARRVAAPVCTDTALLSNLGALPHPPSFSGDGTEPVWFSGPAQMPRGLGVGAVTTAGRLHLCVHYRHALLDRSAAADFTALYCQSLGELAGRPA
jgi:hypothetical protein